jgi:hypothetical protein
MKITQNKSEEKFHPITIVLETDEEAVALMALLGKYTSEEAEKEISDYNFHSDRVSVGVASRLKGDIYRQLDGLVKL